MKKTLLERFLAKVNKTDTCWLWTGGKTSKGYGAIKVAGKTRPAHIVAFELFTGKSSEGHDLHHKCEVRNCVNPDHLELLLRKDHIMVSNGITKHNAEKTHCPYGHGYQGENLIVTKFGRMCRLCHNKQVSSWNKSHRSKQ